MAKISPGENFATFRNGERFPAQFSPGEPPPPPGMILLLIHLNSLRRMRLFLVPHGPQWRSRGFLQPKKWAVVIHRPQRALAAGVVAGALQPISFFARGTLYQRLLLLPPCTHSQAGARLLGNA